MITDKNSAGNRRRKEACAPKPSGFNQISPREMDVLTLIAAGRSTKRIAADLGISPKTVECHRAQIMRKSGCRTLFELGAAWNSAFAQAPTTNGAGEPSGSTALRLALASVMEMGNEASRHDLQIDHLTAPQLRKRARDNRDDAFSAVQRGAVATAAMLLNDAERCEMRVATLETANTDSRFRKGAGAVRRTA